MAGGTKTSTFEFTDGPSSSDYNNWQRLTVETRGDGSTITVFTNFLGQVLLRSITSGSDTWNDYQQYDDIGRLALQATPAAVASYSYDDTSLSVTLNSTTGLIRVFTYSGPGLAEIRIQDGSSGTLVLLRTFTYTSQTVGGITVNPISQQVAYQSTFGTVAIPTSWSYSWYSGTVQIQQRTTTLPLVSTSNNGSGTADVRRELYDVNGYLIATQDERGYINTFDYDTTLGVVLTQVLDDDAPSGSGWTANSGTRLKLTSDFEYDEIGRQTQSLGPSFVDANGDTVRTAAWTVYNDFEDQVLTGQGYATGPSTSYTYTLINPVSISQMDQNGRVIDSIQAPQSSTSSPLSPSDSFPADFPQDMWSRWTHNVYDDETGLLQSTWVYFDIPTTGSGTAGTNYDETSYTYDSLNRQNSVTSPAGTITWTVYESRGLVLATFIGTDAAGATDTDPTGGGTAGNNMVAVATNIYDANGNLTQVTKPVDSDSADNRVTVYGYDFRNRQISIDGEVDFYQENVYDNLDEITQVTRYDTTASGNLIAKTVTGYDHRGRVYRTTVFAVDPTTGATGNSLADNAWYDGSGNVIKSLPAGSQVFTKTIYDGVGRATGQYQGYYTGSGTEPYSSVGQITTSNIIFLQSLSTFDGAGNVTMSAQFQRFDTATGGGPLNDPSGGTQPYGRPSYQAAWFDGIGRSVATAEYGTNGNVGSPTPPSTPPASSDTVLVNQTAYNDAGEAYQATDPAGIVTSTDYDNVGRTKQTVQDSGGLGLTTQMTYHPGGQIETLTANNSITGNQVTTYAYGVTLTGSQIASNDLLASVEYPDSTVQESYQYNRQQERIQLTDRNGTVHTYDYDGLGRTDGGSCANAGYKQRRDGRRHSTSDRASYEVRGMLQTVTSYDASDGGSVVNEAEMTYNDFAQLAIDYQQHSGSVDTSSTTSVQYAYANGSANTIRPTGVTYPDGTVFGLSYGTTGGVPDLLSRAASLTWNSTTVCSYVYIGMNQFVQAVYNEPGCLWNLITGSGANPYAGLDQFGRLIDCYWQQSSTSSTAAGAARLRL